MTTLVRDITLTANGVRHHVIARGAQELPIVMMIHGLTQQAHVFDAIATALADKYHVYCLDVRGRGESDWGPPDGYHMVNYVDDLEAVRQGLGIGNFSLVGTSMGGLISTFYAAKHPDRVNKVVMNDIGPAIDPAGLQRILTMAGSAPEAFRDLNSVAKYYRTENAQVLANRNDDEVMEYARWHVRLTDLGTYAWKMDPEVRVAKVPSVPQPDPWEGFKAIQCPVLVVRGSTSDVLSASILADMKEARPGTESVEVPGVGHAPSLVEPEAKQALEAFLAK